MPPPMPDEGENFGGSLVSDDIMWKRSIVNKAIINSYM